MVGSIRGYTTNYRFILVDYNVQGWHTYEYKNWRSLDAVLGSLVSLLNYEGVWENATAYTVNDIVADESNGLLYKCAVGHTSAAAGSFVTDRTANPTYWTTVDQTAFDATSNKLMKRINRMFHTAQAVLAGANNAALRANAAVSTITTASATALLASQNAAAATRQGLIVVSERQRIKGYVRRAENLNNPLINQVFS